MLESLELLLLDDAVIGSLDVLIPLAVIGCAPLGLELELLDLVEHPLIPVKHSNLEEGQAALQLLDQIKTH